MWELADPELEESVGAVLAETESLLHHGVASADPLINEAARHLTAAGGKRFRPLLTALGGHFGDPRSPLLPRAAAVVELTHLATLYHDEIGRAHV